LEIPSFRHCGSALIYFEIFRAALIYPCYRIRIEKEVRFLGERFADELESAAIIPLGSEGAALNHA
jgi:hypothetical protein